VLVGLALELLLAAICLKLPGVKNAFMALNDALLVIERATQAGIALEVECFDVGHVVSAIRWLEEGILPPPLRINLVLGVPGGIDASPEALAAMVRPLPPDAFWTVTCIGRHHPRMLALALLHGAPGIRTGLEDVAYLRRGVLAPSNAALVRQAAEICAEYGRRPATPAEAEMDRLVEENLAADSLSERRRTYQRMVQLWNDQAFTVWLPVLRIKVPVRDGFGNVHPTVIPHRVLWNIERVFSHHPSRPAA
jgi:hypothetical protein